MGIFDENFRNGLSGILAGIAAGSFVVGALAMSAMGMINTKTIVHLLLVFDNGQSAFVAADGGTADKILQKAKYVGTIDL